VFVDSNPLKTYRGKIKSLAQSASTSGADSSIDSLVDYMESLSTRSFGAVFEVDTRGDPLYPGVTARVTIEGKNLKDALSIPRQALYQKEGGPVVYVRRAEGWEAREVRVQYLTESRAVIEGLAEGTEVALVNPDQQKNRVSGKPALLTPSIRGVTQ